MAIDRVSPSGPPLIQPDRSRLQPQGPAPGGGAADAGDDFALAPLDTSEVGTLLDGLDALGGSALPGGSAMAQAMAAEAVLANDPAAMRPNQIFLTRQLVWHPPDPALMAGSWFVMVRTYGEQRAAWLEQANGQHVPSSLFMADHTPAAMRDGRPGLPLVTEMEPWRFAVYAWGAERLVLKVIVKDDEEQERNNRRRRSRVALRLELMLPGVGRVVIQMEPATGNGVALEVGAAQTSAMQHMREMLPQLAATVSRCGLTILRCRLRRELPPAGGEHHYPTRAHTAALSQAIFKAMAELAVLLSQPLPPDDLFSESA